MGNILEFNGLGGSGKSTVMREVVNDLEKEGLYFELSQGGSLEQIKKYSYANFKLKYIDFTWFITSVYFTLLVMVTFIYSNNQSLKRRIRYLKMILQLWLIYRVFEKSDNANCFLLVDEGIIEGFASLIWTGRYSKNLVKRAAKCITVYSNILIVNFEMDYEWSFQNIRKRNSRSRLDKLPDDELEIALRHKEELLLWIRAVIVRTSISSISVMSRENILHNARIIKEKVHERIN